ncbi:hypothetical protein K443DRAFT_676136, partial [Laccaria amethystina LaAM-08-1]
MLSAHGGPSTSLNIHQIFRISIPSHKEAVNLARCLVHHNTFRSLSPDSLQIPSQHFLAPRMLAI